MAEVIHTGMVGQGGESLLEFLRQNGVDTGLVESTETPQGHAVIQVAPGGENCIILYPGSNFAVTKAGVDRVFARLEGPGYIIVQNEIEGAALTGKNKEEIISALQERCKELGIVLTLGSQGCICVKGGKRVCHGIFPVPAVDTTGVWDTFSGYFVASLARGLGLEQADTQAPPLRSPYPAPERLDPSQGLRR